MCKVARKKGTYQGKAESPQGLGQQKLPCNCVTNPLAPTARLYPINTWENWGSGPFRPHTLGEGGRPWLESVINSPIASCIVSRSLLSRPGTRTTGRTNPPASSSMCSHIHALQLHFYSCPGCRFICIILSRFFINVLIYNICFSLGPSLVAQQVKNLPAMQETPVWFLGWEDLLKKA